ncbi:hypothetical protein ACS0TY_021766 [Phlomoides rotata]
MKGYLGIWSLRIANASLLYKLACDIMRNPSPDISLLYGCYISRGGLPQNYSRVSSIWPGIRGHLPRLVEGSRWVIEQDSTSSFWNDNWLGYTISDMIGTPPQFAAGLKSTIRDFYFDDH